MVGPLLGWFGRGWFETVRRRRRTVEVEAHDADPVGIVHPFEPTAHELDGTHPGAAWATRLELDRERRAWRQRGEQLWAARWERKMDALLLKLDEMRDDIRAIADALGVQLRDPEDASARPSPDLRLIRGDRN